MRKLRLVVVSFCAGALCALGAVAAASAPGVLSRVRSPDAKAIVEAACPAHERAALRGSAAVLRDEIRRDLADGRSVSGAAARLDALQRRLADCD